MARFARPRAGIVETFNRCINKKTFFQYYEYLSYGNDKLNYTYKNIHSKTWKKNRHIEIQMKKKTTQ